MSSGIDPPDIVMENGNLYVLNKSQMNVHIFSVNEGQDSSVLHIDVSLTVPEGRPFPITLSLRCVWAICHKL